MDAYDGKMLKLLAQNARITGAEIARKIHLSVPAVTERLRKLTKSRVIDRYTILLNRQKLSLHVMAFIYVWIDHTTAFLKQPFLAKDFIRQFYSTPLLKSKQARQLWVAPDKNTSAYLHFP